MQGIASDTWGAGVRQGIKANFQNGDLIQENGEFEGIRFHLKEGKKQKDLEYRFKESQCC